jgi:inhibitor of the pro-sigma K processing machinery
METEMENAYLGIILLAVIFVILLFTQLKSTLLHLIGKGIVHIVIGGFILYFANLAGGIFGFSIPFNAITVGVAGILGIPGVAALVCIKLFII